MAGNAYTDSSALAGLIKTAYDRYVEFALRSQPLIRSVADKRPAQQAMPGSSVVFSIYNDLAPATSALSSESVDPDAVALSDVSTVSVTLAEYGNTSLVTRKLQLFSLSDVDPAVADIIAYNQADSLDRIAMETLRQGTNVLYAGTSSHTSTATIASTDTIRAADIRKAVAKLRANKAVPREGSLYWCGIHPEVSHDLRAETGVGGWNDMHKYAETGTGQFWPGTIGTFEGAYFVETPRMYRGLDGVDQSTFTTTTTTAGASAAYTITVASTSGMEAGDKVAATGVASGAKIASISGLVVTLDTANSGAVTSGATVTITPPTANYRTILAGKQALAEAVAQEPGVVVGPVTDKLMRFRPIGWYGVLGFARYREAALYRIESSSSISAQLIDCRAKSFLALW